MLGSALLARTAAAPRRAAVDERTADGRTAVVAGEWEIYGRCICALPSAQAGRRTVHLRPAPLAARPRRRPDLRPWSTEEAACRRGRVRPSAPESALRPCSRCRGAARTPGRQARSTEEAPKPKAACRRGRAQSWPRVQPASMAAGGRAHRSSNKCTGVRTGAQPE
ncbi:hypothetical protein PVAP13_4NG171711 [Panicum virgatum]|uniref:Uncharacterized protein n=1 Tax=Panicum virgatum TaxID=38727 RepID=A0A8T0THU4_PANVG|nr:hypothetical protein PVAP13_4NG171711 [Panicum virgatum]